MAIKRGSKYYCPICNKAFINANQADLHRDTEHDVIYVPMERADAGRLIQYIYTGDDKLIPQNLVATLRDVMKKSTRIQKDEEI